MDPADKSFKRGVKTLATTQRKEQALEDGLVQTVFKPCAEILVRCARPQPGERLLDVGCGSGIVARTAIESQPQLSSSSGFDFEPAAVEVARLAASRHVSGTRLTFWQGDASKAAEYGASWNICIAQHVLQHVPAMLEPLRASLVPGGRAVVATWPLMAAGCPAYEFLYSAAEEPAKLSKPIGLSLDDLQKQLRQAGFRKVSVCAISIMTPTIQPRTFLKQYLEGKQDPPADIEERVARAKLETAVDSSGNARFEVAMNVAIADG